MNIKRFIIVDDDPVNNTLCRYLISKAVAPETEIMDYTSAQDALFYLMNSFESETPNPTILFLDINMPDIDGWEFLSRYVDLPLSVKKQISIYILSSSIDNRDKDRAKQNPLVTDFIVKPLRVETIENILSKNVAGSN